MIKKSRRVLAIVMALAMLASVFVGTSAFAAGPVDPAGAVVMPFFGTKGANGVHQPLAADDVATVKYYREGSATAMEVNAPYYVGERYTVKLTQTSAQAAKYDLSTNAKVSVDLGIEGITPTVHDFYMEDFALTSAKSGTNTVYTGTFTALGSAAEITKDIPGDSINNLYFEVTMPTIKVESVSLPEVTTAPLAGSETLVYGQDAYFTATANNQDNCAYLLSNPTIKAYDKDGKDLDIRALNIVPDLDPDKGVGVYKLIPRQVNTILKTDKVASIKVSMEPVVKTTTEKFIKVADEDDWTITPEKIYEGTVVTVKYTGEIEDGKVFGGIIAMNDKADKQTEVALSQTIDKDNNTTTFIMPKAVDQADTGKYKDYITIAVKESDPANTVTLSYGRFKGYSNDEITLEVGGPAKEIVIKPTEGYAFRESAVDVYRAAAFKSDNGGLDGNYQFTFKGYKDGNLYYDVKATSDASSSAGNAKLKLMNGPAVTDKFIPAVKFDQKIIYDSVEGDSVGVKLVTVGTDGILNIGGTRPQPILIAYDGNSLKFGKASLGSTDLVVDTETLDEAYTTVIPTEKGVLAFDTSYLTGAITANAENGSVKITDKDKVVTDRAKEGTEIYLEPTAKDGYKFDSITAAITNSGAEVAVTKISDTLYKFKMPGTNTANYGASVTVTANFSKIEGIVTINNLLPEASKDTNGGFLTIDKTTVKAGDTFNVTGTPNDKYLFVEAFAKYTNTSGVETGIVGKLAEKVWTFTVPADIDATKPINVSGEFASQTAIKINNSKPESDKATNNGYITGIASYAEPGSEVSLQALANDGYELDSLSAFYTAGDEIVPIETTVVEGTLGGYKFNVPNTLVKEKNEITVSATFTSIETKDAWVKDSETGKWTYWKDGIQVTGWFKDGGKEWFYCDPTDGFLKTGWFKDGGKTWYYSFTKDDATRGNREGVMSTNQWVKGVYDGRWFYINANGAMETNKWVRTSTSAAWSWVGTDGAWQYDA